LTPLLTAIPIDSVVEATKTHGTRITRAAREPADDGNGKCDHPLNVAGERFCLHVSLQQLSRLGSRGNPLVAEEDLIDRLADEIGDGADVGAACHNRAPSTVACGRTSRDEWDHLNCSLGRTIPHVATTAAPRVSMRRRRPLFGRAVAQQARPPRGLPQ
jgi:hypothetical protein